MSTKQPNPSSQPGAARKQPSSTLPFPTTTTSPLRLLVIMAAAVGGCVLVMILVTVVLSVIEEPHRKRLTPPEEVTSFSAFIDWAPPVRAFSLVTRRDQPSSEVYLAASLPSPKFTYGSGPPTYVFDRQGVMVAWAFAGHEENFPWRPVKMTTEPLSPAEVRAWFQAESE